MRQTIKLSKLSVFAVSCLLFVIGIAFLHPSSAHADESDCSQTDSSTSSSCDTPDPSTTSTTGTGDNTTSDQTATTGDATVDSGTDPDPTTTSDTTPTDPTDTNPDSTCPTTDSTDPSDQGTAADSTDNDSNNACITNNDGSSSQSGDASVTDATTGGDSTTGTSSDDSNLINQINSTTNLNGPGTSTFTDNIDGNTTGNIDIDPTSLADQNSDPSQTGSSTTDLNDDTNATINNNLDLNANSGNALVQNNGSDGTSNSGNATAIANLVNLIDSMISDGQSFIGTVNIYGNLDGNILIPQQLVDQMADTSDTDPLNLSSLDQVGNLTINNNVLLNAESGNAAVDNNGDDGTATSGNAQTNLSIYNLTGSQIIASNALLVIVNVEGTWEGFILNAPAGTNTALLTGGLVSETQQPVNVSSSTNETINNNVFINSESGNATVDNEGNGGTATTGNALADANIINILGDQFDLSGWFGILFINVFGNWDGSLSIYNADPIVTTDYAPIEQQGRDPSSSNNNTGASTFYTVYSNNAPNQQPVSGTGYVLASSFKPATNLSPQDNLGSSSHKINWWIIVISLSLAGSMLASERLVKSRRSR